MKIKENDILIVKDVDTLEEKKVIATEVNKYNNRFLYIDSNGKTGFKRNLDNVIKRIKQNGSKKDLN